MTKEFTILNKDLKVDLNNPIDLSLTSKSQNSFKAWYVKEVQYRTIQGEGFTGSVKEGGAVNFREILINPHGNTTHTESVGHISELDVFINETLNHFHFLAQVISLTPEIIEKDKNEIQKKGDRCIFLDQILNKIDPDAEALIIRSQKIYNELHNKKYDGTNWPYLDRLAAKYIRDQGIKHLLIDQPSVDKENDKGTLLSHKAFWNYPQEIDRGRTITELIGVPDHINDGIYLLNLTTINLENDASPSRPIIYKLF